jgi:hypothetical protein
MTSKQSSPMLLSLVTPTVNSQIGTPNGSEPVPSSKRLGDPVYTPGSQSIGFCTYESGFEDLETFEKLAHVYKVDGEDRTEICRFNASVSQT